MGFDPSQSQAEVLLLIESITLVIAIGCVLLSCACIPVFVYYILRWNNGKNVRRAKSTLRRVESQSEDDTVELMVEQHSDLDSEMELV